VGRCRRELQDPRHLLLERCELLRRSTPFRAGVLHRVKPIHRQDRVNLGAVFFVAGELTQPGIAPSAEAHRGYPGVFREAVHAQESRQQSTLAPRAFSHFVGRLLPIGVAPGGLACPLEEPGRLIE
jgi:hypothetical protein